MAGINRYYNYTPLQKEDYSFKMPLDVIGKTLMHLQDTSDKNYAELQQLPGLIHTNALTGHDTTRRNQIQQSYNDQISKMVSSANGDYSRVNKDIIGLKAKLQKDLTIGDLAAIGSNYKTFADFQKETLSQKDLPKSYADAAINKTLAEYNEAGGYGGIDPVTGNYRQISPIRGQGFNVQENLAKIGEFKPLTIEQDKRIKEGDYWRNITTKDVTYDKNLISNAMAQNLMSNPLFVEHLKYRARIGMPMSEEELTKEVMAETARRSTGEIHTQKSDYDFDQRIAINAANERARLGRAQAQRHHDEKMAAEFGAYDGRQAILGAETTGAWSGELNFSGGKYNQDGTPFVSKGTTALGGYYTQSNTPSVTLTGKEPISFNHPVIKNNPIAQKALVASYIRLTKDNSLLSKSQEDQNKILSAWSSNPDNRATIQASIKEEAGKLAKVYNNRSVSGFRIAGKQAEAEGNDMLAASRSIVLKDLNTGQAYGTLSDYLKSQNIDERTVSTSVTDTKDNTGAKLHVTAVKDGYRTIEIKTKNGTRSMRVEGFDRDREASGNKVANLTNRTTNTAFHAPIMTDNGYENMTNIESYPTGGKYFYSDNIVYEGQRTADGIVILGTGILPNKEKIIKVRYPNGSEETMKYETQNDASRAFHQKDKARLYKTKQSVRTTDVEYNTTGE